MFRSEYLPRITFAQLDKALKALGFVRGDTPQYIAYTEAEHDTIILLRKLKDQEIVGGPYLVGIQSTIVGKGIASSARLRALLTRHSMTPLIAPRGTLRTKARKSLAERGTSRPVKGRKTAVVPRATASISSGSDSFTPL